MLEKNMRDKSRWIDMNQNVTYGGDIYKHYMSEDKQYDILHKQGNKKQIAETLYFPIESKVDGNEVVDVLARFYSGLLI